jgi:Spy/CpxP family protein refolding chaperone
MTPFKSLVLASVAVATLSTAAFAAPGMPHGRGPHSELENILTDAQKAELKAARDDYMAKRQAVMSSLSSEQKQKLDAVKAERKQRFEQMRQKIDAILTPDQKAKLDTAKSGKDFRTMTPAERKSFGEARRDVFKSLTPDQRQQMDELRQH